MVYKGPPVLTWTNVRRRHFLGGEEIYKLFCSGSLKLRWRVPKSSSFHLSMFTLLS